MGQSYAVCCEQHGRRDALAGKEFQQWHLGGPLHQACGPGREPIHALGPVTQELSAVEGCGLDNRSKLELDPAGAA